MRSLIKITTEDGSDTFYIPELNEHYHSIHGAKQESDHVYIKSGLDYFLNNNIKKELNLLEIGFGTGMNTLLVGIWAELNKIKVQMTSIEPYPIPSNHLSNYNHNIAEKAHLYDKITSSSWNEKNQISEFFTLNKSHTSLEDFNSIESFDVIFFDAFAPEKQPEVWSLENFSKLYSITNVKGVLVTYCAKGSVRRQFKEVEYVVSRIEGPPGKREMLRCVKII